MCSLEKQELGTASPSPSRFRYYITIIEIVTNHRDCSKESFIRHGAAFQEPPFLYRAIRRRMYAFPIWAAAIEG